jgi:hypothetical protein
MIHDPPIGPKIFSKSAISARFSKRWTQQRVFSAKIDGECSIPTEKHGGPLHDRVIFFDRVPRLRSSDVFRR